MQVICMATQGKAKRAPVSNLQEFIKNNKWLHILPDESQDEYANKEPPNIPINTEYHYDSSAIIQFVQETTLQKERKMND